MLVSLWSAGAAGLTDSTTSSDLLIERAICYSTDDTEYHDCMVARDNGRASGHELLKPPMLTPFRVSLCVTLQFRFSSEDFWDCVKALGDPRR